MICVVKFIPFPPRHGDDFLLKLCRKSERRRKSAYALCVLPPATRRRGARAPRTPRRPRRHTLRTGDAIHGHRPHTALTHDDSDHRHSSHTRLHRDSHRDHSTAHALSCSNRRQMPITRGGPQRQLDTSGSAALIGPDATASRVGAHNDSWRDAPDPRCPAPHTPSAEIADHTCKPHRISSLRGERHDVS